MAAGEIASPAPVCVVGARVLRDFHASLCAANLLRAGVEARAVELELDVGRPEANALGLARASTPRHSVPPSLPACCRCYGAASASPCPRLWV